MGPDDVLTDTLREAQARVRHDLMARALDTEQAAAYLEEVLRDRRWWLEQWPDGEGFIPCLVAQDIQDRLLDNDRRWPLCTTCNHIPEHSLHIDPAMTDDPYWVCDHSGLRVARLGELPI